MVRGYAEVRDSRRGYLLNYFGEEFEPPCGHCDNCQVGIVAEVEDEPFPINGRVSHEEWNRGTVQRYESDKKMIALFDQVGYKTLSVVLVKERGLLKPIG